MATDRPMQLGMIGLGRMGANLVRRLMRDGHRCVVYDVNSAAVKQLEGEGAVGATSLEDFVAKLEKPRNAWLMLPAAITGQTLDELAELLEPGDAVIDGGNSYYRDDISRARQLAPKQIYYLDCGTSGGVFGLDRGYCLMIGGEDEAFERLDPILATIAPGIGTAEPGLKFPQRLCYFNAMMHFLYAVPRLIFLSAPLIYLLLNHTNVPGYWAAILAYALPHLTLSNVTNSRIQGEHRHSFWNEIYETVLSPYILLPTMMALINPRLGKFNVTAKGGVVKRTFFDVKIAQPFLIMLLFNIAGLIVAIPRFFIWDRDRPGTVLMNVIWCCFNVVILGVCTAVARELRQLRTTVRISIVTPVVARMPDGSSIAGETINLSSGGTSIRFNGSLELASQTEVHLAFPSQAMGVELPATVVSSEGSVLRVRFEALSIFQEEVLTLVLYSRADSWKID